MKNKGIISLLAILVLVLGGMVLAHMDQKFPQK